MSSCVVRSLPRRPRTVAAVAGLACLACLTCLTGCGDGARPAAPATTTADVPAPLSGPRRTGEVVLDGDAAPATHGPIALHGRYRVRFAQYAPEDPRLDFTTQTAFVARLRPSASPRSPGAELFHAAAAGAARRLTLDGRYELEVAFGDFPYVIRFTPIAGGR